MEIGAKEVSGGGEIIGSEDSTCWEESCGEDEEIIGEETWRAGDRSCDEIGNEVSLGRGEDEACSAGCVSVLTCCIWTEDEDGMLEKIGKETEDTEPGVAGERTPFSAGNLDSSNTTCLDT